MRSMRVEAAAAVVLAVVAVLTVVWPDWIEGLFGVDPDGGSGAVEAAIVVVCALAAGGLWAHERARARRVSRSRSKSADRAKAP